MKLYTPADGAVVSLMTDQQKYFRAHTDKLIPDPDVDWRNLVRSAAPDCSIPLGVRFSWENTGEHYVLTVSESPDMSDALRFETTASEYLWENGRIGTAYYWQVNGSPVQSFITESLPPRFLHIDGTTNVRDMGGWRTAEGRVIRQGLLYRGSELDIHVTVTEEGTRTLQDTLGVRTDLDLRGEVVGKRSDSPLGPAVRFCLLPIKAYGELIQNPANIREIFALLADETNYPLYFHCWGGADRTGTLAYLLCGLLGVPQQDLILDYELTSLSIWGNRSRSSDDFTGLLQALDAWGDTPKTQAENFLRSVGVTEEEFAKIRKIFLE